MIRPNGTIENYPAIKLKTFAGKKNFNETIFRNNLAYISTGFGIVVFDMNKLEIKDYPTFMSSFEKLLSHNYFDDVIIIADEFMHGIIHEINLERKNLKIIEYTDDIIEQI